METIKLNNVHIIKESVFKEFNNKRVSIQYYWKNNDRLIGWNDSNTLKSSYSESDVLIKCLTFENNTETYQLFIDDEYIPGDLIELTIDDTTVYCKLIIIWN